MKILKLLVLTGDKVYVKAVGRAIMILLYQRGCSVKTSWAYLTEMNFNLLNEEIGEISLSILQRAVLQSPLRRDVEHISEKYRGVSVVVDNMSSQMMTMSTRFSKDRNSNRRTMSEESKESIRMKAFLEEQLRMIADDNVTIYESAKGFKSKADGDLTKTGKVKIKPRYGNAVAKLQLLMANEKKAWEKKIPPDRGGAVPAEVLSVAKDDDTATSSDEGTHSPRLT